MQDGRGKKGTAGGGAKETVAGTGYKQGDRVIVVGRDGEDRKTYRTATVATVRLMALALYSLYAVCVGLCNFSSLLSVCEQRKSTNSSSSPRHNNESLEEQVTQCVYKYAFLGGWTWEARVFVCPGNCKRIYCRVQWEGVVGFCES